MFKPYPYSPGSGKTFAFSLALQQLLLEHQFRRNQSHSSAAHLSARGTHFFANRNVLALVINTLITNSSRTGTHG